VTVVVPPGTVKVKVEKFRLVAVEVEVQTQCVRDTVEWVEVRVGWCFTVLVVVVL